MAVAKKKPGRPPAKTTPKKKVVEPLKVYCRVCQATKASSGFYESKNKLDSNGFLSICKDCVNKMFDEYYKIFNNFEQAIKITCEEIDLVYYSPSVEGVKTRMAKAISEGREFNNPFGHYKSMVSQNHDNVTGMRYRDSYDAKAKDDKPFKTNYAQEEDFESITLDNLISRWGNLEIPDLQWLEERYSTFWDRKYTIDGARQMLVEQICFIELSIRKNRSDGRGGGNKEDLMLIQNLLKTANLSPKQETASEEAEFQTISEFIKKVEQSKPIVGKNPVYKDVDGFSKMWKSLAGAIKRTAGRADEDTDTFNETFKEHTLDLSNLESGGDS